MTPVPLSPLGAEGRCASSQAEGAPLNRRSPEAVGFSPFAIARPYTSIDSNAAENALRPVAQPGYLNALRGSLGTLEWVPLTLISSWKTMANPSDRDLGMDRPITRRDFLNGVGLALTGSLAYPWFEALGSPPHSPPRRPLDITPPRRWGSAAATTVPGRSPTRCAMGRPGTPRLSTPMRSTTWWSSGAASAACQRLTSSARRRGRTPASWCWIITTISGATPNATNSATPIGC